jgi:WD40 repeat protein
MVQCVVAVSNEQIASGSTDSSIKIWNKSTGECFKTLEGHTGWISTIKVMSEQLFSCSNDTLIKIWDLKTYKLIKVRF